MDNQARTLTDLLAGLLSSGPLSAVALKELASSIDERGELIPIHGFERLLETDDRFEFSDGVWRLARDAPVGGVAPTGDDVAFPEHREPAERLISDFILLDVETAGREPDSALIEIAALRVTGWQVAGQFESLVYAAEIPSAVEALTGISHSMVRAAPTSVEAVAAFRRFADDLPVMGHNVTFDITAVRLVEPSFSPTTLLDTLELAHVVFPAATSRALESLAHDLGVDVATAHRALADCRTTLEVARALVGLLGADDPPFGLIRDVLQRAHHPWARLLAPPPSVTPTLEHVRGIGPMWLSSSTTQPPRSVGSEEAFRDGGAVMQRAAGAEYRPAQLEMAREVERAFAGGDRLLVEAPTGTGKTFAYLVPATAHASRSGKPVWISTHTKSLQTQLQRDFLRLSELDVASGNLAVLKGRENYLCTRDLMAATAVDLTPEAGLAVAMLVNLLATSQEGEIGEVTDFWLTRQYPDAAEIRNTVRLNPATCEQSQCEFYDVCPYFSARRRVDTAALVAVNHALLITEMGGEDGLDLPELSGLVIDEAHTLEDAATSVLTLDLDPRTVTGWLNRLVDPDVSSGLLRNVGRGFGLRARDDLPYAAALEVARRARTAIRVFAERMTLYLAEFVGRPQDGEYPVTHRFRLGIDDRRFLFLESRQALFTFAELARELVETLRALHREVEGRSATDGHNAKALRHRLWAEAARGSELVELSLTLLSFSDDNHVAYATWEKAEGDLPALVVTKAPIDVSRVLRSTFGRAPVVVATSATLTVGGTFEFMRERLAAEDFIAVSLPNTFDYSTQAALILTRHLPAPRADKEAEFVEAVADTAIAAIGTSRGGTLGLFTAKKRLLKAFELAEPGIRYEGLDLRAQVTGASTRELADWFRTHEAGSLFGLRSFWEGFDAPGETMRSLLIEKIPFPSPGDPLFAARSDRLEGLDRDPFYELAVPLAALVFKQGFGRLIRSRSDRGVVTVLDRRLRTGLTYQHEFLASLPDDLPILYPADEEEYLATLATRLGVEPRPDLARGVGPRRSVVDLARTTIRDSDDPAQVREGLAAVLELFGMDNFRPGQEELIRAVVVDRRDAVGLMPTGAGKSLVYQAAAMCLDGVGVVVSPLIALMKDQVDTLRDELGFRWGHAIYGGMSGSQRDEVIDAVRQGGCRLLYVSPERLRDPTLIRALSTARITFVAVDEAHCVSVWGHDFRPDFLTIVPALSNLPHIDEVPRIALTATAPRDVLEDVLQQLRLRSPVIERRSVDRPNLQFSVIRCSSKKAKRAQLLRIALAHDEAPGVVYCPTRKDAEAAAALLRSHDINARHYHAGMPAEQREAVQEMFMSDQVQIICATNAFGLGVDKPNIGFVAHWALPFSLDAYFQEAGRAARDPSISGSAILLWATADTNMISRLLSRTLPDVQALEKLALHIARLSQPYATVDDLAHATGLDETSVRVGIHLLDRAGAIEQGVDVAARGFLAIPASLERIASRFGGDVAGRVKTICDLTNLRPGGRSIVDILDLAEAMQYTPASLESELLDLADGEVMAYRPVLRAMTLHHKNSDWDRHTVESDLARLRQSAFSRLDEMVAYAKSHGCRRQQILAHFDEVAGDSCGMCDNCVGEPELLSAVDPLRYSDVDVVTDQVAQAIIGLVREASRLGSTPGRRSFVRGLAGVQRWGEYETPTVLQRSRYFGSLSYMTPQEIEEAIDAMISRNRILEIEHRLSNGDTYVGLDVRS